MKTGVRDNEQGNKLADILNPGKMFIIHVIMNNSVYYFNGNIRIINLYRPCSFDPTGDNHVVPAFEAFDHWHSHIF